jgi:hypothetical protein
MLIGIVLLTTMGRQSSSRFERLPTRRNNIAYK